MNRDVFVVILTEMMKHVRDSTVLYTPATVHPIAASTEKTTAGQILSFFYEAGANTSFTTIGATSPGPPLLLSIDRPFLLAQHALLTDRIEGTISRLTTGRRGV